MSNLFTAIAMTAWWQGFWKPGDGCSRWEFVYRLNGRNIRKMPQTARHALYWLRKANLL